MRRVLALWLLVFAVASGGAVVTYTRCPGCIARDRVNTSCEWTGDASFPLEPGNPAHRAHLVQDAHLAEELAIRYADAEFGRRFGVVEHHGGLLENGDIRRQCLARLFHAIENGHGVTPEAVRVARAQRNRVFDTAVALLFLLFYSLGAVTACRSLNRRFWSNERYARIAATGLASVAAAFLGAQCFRLWGGLWEMIRVGNGHMTSIRAASRSAWIHQYAGADLIAGMLVFWIVALICSRDVPEDPHAADVSWRRGILLR